MEFEFEVYDNIRVDMEEVLSQVERYNIKDIIEFRDYVNEIIEEKGGGGGEPKIINRSDDTMVNSEKIKFLIDNIWNISLEDLENIKK
jgi:hypothetical protein